MIEDWTWNDNKVAYFKNGGLIDWDGDGTFLLNLIDLLWARGHRKFSWFRKRQKEWGHEENDFLLNIKCLSIEMFVSRNQLQNFKNGKFLVEYKCI